ncbi:MAG: TonB-dependent receptor, partial [Rhizobiales bacterium]|nr:TonB-dependent receptor [Hyphomicrobiales bacterium]
LEATYGSYDRIDVKGAYDLPLIKDQLALRVSGFTNNQTGFQTLLDYACANPSTAGNIPVAGSAAGNCVIGHEGGTRRWGVRAALRYTPSSNVEVNISGDRTVDNSDPAPLSLFYAFAPFGAPTYNGSPTGTPWDARFLPAKKYTTYATYRDTVAGFDAQAKTFTKGWGVSGDINWKIGDNLSLRSITAYRGLETQAGFDQDGSPIGVATTLIYNTYHQFTQELRLSGTSHMLDWTVGGFYYNAKGVLLNTIDSGPTQFKTNDPVKTTSKSVFGHVVIHPVEGLNITAGIRYTDDRKTYQFTRYNLNNGPANPAQGPLNNLPLQVYAGDRVDYRIGVDYRFSPEVMAYAQFSTGYKGGGVNAKPFVAIQAVPFNPESIDSWEAGLKTDLADNHVRLNLAGFYMKYKNIVLVNAAGYPGGCLPTAVPLCANPDPNYYPLSALPFNAGDANIKGLELEADIRPVGGLSITGSLSYLDFKYTKLAVAALASGISLKDYPPLTPKWKASGGIAYTFEMQNGATITPRVDIDYQSKTYSDPANNGFYPAGLPQDPQFANVN